MGVLSLAVALVALQADTVAPAAAVESPYTIRSAGLELAGTLTVPRGVTKPMPVVVIIAGSGPTDRNGNSMMGIRPNSYAQLAWGLAERGIASLRYDKRGLPGTKGTFDITHMTMADFAADARTAAESLSRDPRFSRVVFVGHSEGASLALMAAREGAPVTDVVHVSGLGRATGEVLREQLSRQFDSATLVRYDSAMKYYLAGESAAVPSGLEMLFVPMNRTYMRSMMAFDPSAAIRAVRQPVLIVQGATDLQASVADAERLHAARPDAKLVVIPEVNHVLKHDTNPTITVQMATTYKDPTMPIAPAVVAAIADWILRPRP
ncbi:MAG TPA: alpha/beta hydrolase [Gemmatimonadales bacterium]|nr:alpha/beta hydrolase [Gemmatimonadales bacterium]